MGVDFAYLVAWTLPALVGAGVWFALRGRVDRAHDLAAAIGAGWLIGVFAAAGIARWAASGDTVHTMGATLPWLLALGALAWIVAALRIRAARTEGRAAQSADIRRTELSARAQQALGVVCGLLVLATLARLLIVGEEASLRPVFPWDAWSAWAVKPKTWFLLGHVEPYTSMAAWLGNPPAMLRTATAWVYPELLAWVQLWFASGAGAWNEPLVDLAWTGALAAFATAAYGYWRAFGLPAWLVLTLVYAFVSLPLIDTHAALAGYADLWVAVTLGVAVLAWTRWLIRRERDQWLLAIGIALCLPAIKLEGAVWLLLFSAVVVLDLIPRRWRWRVAAGIGALAVLGLLLGGFVLPMLGLGLVHVAWGNVDVPVIGMFALQWHSVGKAMLTSLFTLPNWHLLWYVVPVLLVLRWRRFRDDRAARLLGLLLLLDFAFLFVLFFFTGASAWAKDYTSANRLILHVVPSVFVLMAVLLRDPSAISGARLRTQPAPGGPTARA